MMIGEMGARIRRVDWDAAQMLEVLKKLRHVVAYQNWCAPGLSLVGARNTYMPAWKGTLKQMRVMLSDKAESGILRIDYVRMIDTSRSGG